MPGLQVDVKGMFGRFLEFSRLAAILPVARDMLKSGWKGPGCGMHVGGGIGR